MKPRMLILLMVAVGCGLVAAFLTSQMAGKGVDKVKVPVAKTQVQQGTFIKDPELMFDTKEVNRELVLPNTIQNVAELKGKSLQRTLDAGQMVNKNDLLTSEGIIKSLPDGYRAQTIRVTVDSAVTGFIRPGSHVDLLCMMPDSKDPKRTMARIFMQNVQVLAVNTQDRPPENANAVPPPSFVTLALKPDDVEKVARVTKDSIPVMCMRKPGDVETIRTSGAENAFGRGSPETEPADDTKEVLVAKAPIPAGTKIGDPDVYFEVKKVPTDVIPAGAYTDKTKVAGETVHKFLDARQFLTPSYLVKEESGIEKKIEVVVTIPKLHRLKIWNGASLREQRYEDGATSVREEAPAPIKENDGSDGK